MVAALPLGGAVAVASAAQERSVKEHVVLKLVTRKNASHGAIKFKHAGQAKGTLSGAVTSRMTLTHLLLLRGTVTITTSKGKLTVKFDGRARSLESPSWFKGTATIIDGTDRYAHARGRGTFTGLVNRRTWAASIDATGSFTY